MTGPETNATNETLFPADTLQSKTGPPFAMVALVSCIPEECRAQLYNSDQLKGKILGIIVKMAVAGRRVVLHSWCDIKRKYR